MVAALAYQESRIDQNQRSPAGAIKVMSLLASTAKDPNVKIPDTEEIESDIQAGENFLRFLNDPYFEKEPMDFNKKFSFLS